MGGLRPCSLRAARPSLGAPACLPPLATSPPDGSISCRPPGRGRPAFAEVPYPFQASARVVGCPTVQRAGAGAGGGGGDFPYQYSRLAPLVQTLLCTRSGF